MRGLNRTAVLLYLVRVEMASDRFTRIYRSILAEEINIQNRDMACKLGCGLFVSPQLNIFNENAFHGLQKIPLDNFPRNFYIWSAIVSVACMQKIKIGHRANFQAKNKCFRQILFPVRVILRSINFRYADFNTDLADAYIFVMACVDCACACS